MKERPILFKEEMVRAILEGRKTQTRRVYNGKGPIIEVGDIFVTDIPCPYGKKGDCLWVRETFAQRGEMKSVIYKADELPAVGAYGCVKWKPSIFMPRWASRITLEIIGVRLEHLQDISEKDAKAEGVDEVCDICGNSPKAEAHNGHKACYDPGIAYREGYIRLWESINGPGSWDKNPLIWVIVFKKLTEEKRNEIPSK